MKVDVSKRTARTIGFALCLVSAIAVVLFLVEVLLKTDEIVMKLAGRIACP